MEQATLETRTNAIKKRNYVFGEQLYQDMRNGFNCDVLLSMEDWTVKAHRCILESNSAFFREMFQKQRLPTNTLFLPEASRKTLEPLLDFMYGRCLDCTKVPNEDLFQIMALADHFQLHHFKIDCIEFANCYPAHGYLGVAYSVSKHLELRTIEDNIKKHLALSFIPDTNPTFDELVINYGRVSLELLLDLFQTLEDDRADNLSLYDLHSITSLEIRATNILIFIAQHPDLDQETIKNLIGKIKFERLPLRCFDEMLNAVMGRFPELALRNIRRAVNEVLTEIQREIDTDRLAVLVFDHRGCSLKLRVYGPRVREWTDVHCLVGFKVENYYFDGTVIFLAGSDDYATYNVKNETLSDIKKFPEAYKKLAVSCLALDGGNVLYTIGKEPDKVVMSLVIIRLDTEDCIVRPIVDHRTDINSMTVRDATVYFVSGSCCYSLDSPYVLAACLAQLCVPKVTESSKMFLVADDRYLHVFCNGQTIRYDNYYTTVKLEPIDPEEELTEEEERILGKKRMVNRSMFMKVVSCCTINDQVMVLCYCKDSQELQLYKYCNEEHEFKPVAFLGEQQILNIGRPLIVLTGQRE